MLSRTDKVGARKERAFFKCHHYHCHILFYGTVYANSCCYEWCFAPSTDFPFMMSVEHVSFIANYAHFQTDCISIVVAQANSHEY